ncbi:hypothetical protein L1887_44271 [Cichorium endivia]|nr:hypothetical protein L1887_44271 [Cichorium endivia]
MIKNTSTAALDNRHRQNSNHRLPIGVISSIDSDIEISEVNDNSNQMETESKVRLESKIVMESIEFVIDNRYKASDCIDCSGKSITVAADPLKRNQRSEYRFFHAKSLLSFLRNQRHGNEGRG